MAILEDIKSYLPETAMVSDASYEGSEIILYTKNKDFFKNSIKIIKSIVNRVKKRIEVRADPGILENEEKTIELIKKAVPEDAGVKDIYFEPEFAKVVIHAEKPGLVIGKSGETLIKIKESTFWTPEIKRAPVIDSEIIKSVRKMLHKESSYRKKFLNSLGEKIYSSEKKEVDWIRFTTLGGYREVGKSCTFLQTPQSKILLDCGVSVSATASRAFPHLDIPEFDLQNLDAVVISHAHMDHSGFVPYLYEYGYRGPVYWTRPTRDLATLLILDYLQICQRENKKPPYTSKGIEEMLKHSVTLEYGEVSDITPDMRLTLQNAGHILGSSTSHVHIGDGLYNVLYTGDMKYETTRLFDKTSTDYARVEGLIIESTYGGPENLQTSREAAENFLISKIKEAIKRGGKVLIPSFAVGRAQDVIAAVSSSDIEVPIYLDGMLWDSTAIHTAYPEFMCRKVQTQILHKGKNPFVDPRLKGIGSRKERDDVVASTGPCVIIATSGMLAGGPIIEYLQTFCHDPKNMLLFVGYQAEGTMGRRIQKGWKDVQLDNGKMVQLNLEIATVDGLSGHSDHNQLMAFVNNLKNRPKKIITNHGDTTRCVELARTLHKQFRVESVAPKLLETLRFR
jgi:uncharacterized protein